MQVRCPHCQTPVELPADGELSDIACPSCGSSFSLLGTSETIDHEASRQTIGHFELLEKIGVGTFGVVWKARDTELDRTVAVKIPRKGQLDSQETEQFLREARAAAQLRHPHIVSVHEVGRERDTVFIVSDFVEGVTLADRLTARRFSVREAADLCASVAVALHHAHESGVIHRDLKPGNVILDAAASPHIMDFGLARREAGEVTMTVEGRVLGTPAYMSPEQAQGSAHAADRRSDVYSLGVILFELLTGERPFRGNARMLVHQVIHDEPPSPRKLNGSIPRDLETICLKCLEKDAARRYPDAQELADDLQRFLGGSPIAARPITRVERGWRWCRRNTWVAMLAGITAGSLLLGITVATYYAVATDRARVAELAARRQAESSARDIRRRLYAADMYLAERAWDRHDQKFVEDLLRRHMPGPSETDLRGFEWYYLWRLWMNDAPQHTIPYPDLLMDVSASPVTGYIATASFTLTLWDSSTRQPLKRFDGKYEWNEAFAVFSPDGKLVAFPAEGRRSLIVYDVAQDAARQLPHPGSAVVCGAAFSPAGERLASVTADNVVRLWDVSTAEVIREMRGAGRGGRPLAFSPEGDRVACVSGNVVRIWNTETGEVASTLQGHEDLVLGLAWSHDGRFIATAGKDRKVPLWDAGSGSQIHIFDQCQDEARWVAFAPDDSLLLAAERDGVIRVWDAITFEQVKAIRGHNGIRGFGFPSRDTVAFANQDHHIAIGDIRSRSSMPPLQGPPTDLFESDPHLFESHGALILAHRAPKQPGVVHVHRVDESATTPLTPVDVGAVIQSLAVSRRGVLAAAVNDGSRVLLFDVMNARAIGALAVSGVVFGRPPISRQRMYGPLRFSPEGTRLGAGTVDGRVVVWELDETGKAAIVTHHDTGQQGVAHLAFDQYGEVLVTGGSDATISVWKLSESRLMCRLGRASQDLREDIRAMAVSLDAGMIAVSHFGGDVRIWTAPFDRDQQPAVLRRHKATPRGLYFFRDDTTLLTAGTDRVVKLIDIPLSQERLNLEGGVAIFDGITVSPDEKVIAAIGRNGNVFVWRAATPAEVAGTPGWTRHETTRIDASDPSQKPPIPGTIP